MRHLVYKREKYTFINANIQVINTILNIGVRAGGARGAAAPPNFGQLRFFGQQEKIWAKPTFKHVSCFFMSMLER